MGSQSQILKTNFPEALMMQKYAVALAKKYNGRLSTANDGERDYLVFFSAGRARSFQFLTGNGRNERCYHTVFYPEDAILRGEIYSASPLGRRLYDKLSGNPFSYHLMNFVLSTKGLEISEMPVKDDFGNMIPISRRMKSIEKTVKDLTIVQL